MPKECDRATPCTYCGKAIITWKSKDFKGRKMHRTCFHKQIIDWQYAEFMVQQRELDHAQEACLPKEASNLSSFEW